MPIYTYFFANNIKVKKISWTFQAQMPLASIQEIEYIAAYVLCRYVDNTETYWEEYVNCKLLLFSYIML